MNFYDIWFSNLDSGNRNKLKLLEIFECSEIIWGLKKGFEEYQFFSDKWDYHWTFEEDNCC